MIEPFAIKNWVYNYNNLYNQVYNYFVAPYSSLYYFKDGKPLVCFYNDGAHSPGLANNGDVPTDSRFTRIIVGEEPYTEWAYTDLVRSVSRENQESVTPRFDESRLANRPAKTKVDPRLDLGIYDQQWQNAIQQWKEGKVETILISTWNEFYERTAIEPLFDATATNNDPYFLYTKTQNYIAELRQTQPSQTDVALATPTVDPTGGSSSSGSNKNTISSVPEYPVSILFLGSIFAVSLVCIIVVRLVRKNKITQS